MLSIWSEKVAVLHLWSKLVRCKDQRHSLVGECAEGQVKVVLLGHTNLVMTRVSVKVLEGWVFSQRFKHLVKEGERIVVISDSLVDYRYTSLMTSLWNMSALTSEVIAPFFGTTWTRLTKTLSYTGLMTPACSSLNTSWFTTFLIAFFSHHWCSQDDLWFGSIKMQWMHKSGLIPFLVLERIPNDRLVLSLGLQQAAESLSLSACHGWKLAC